MEKETVHAFQAFLWTVFLVAIVSMFGRAHTPPKVLAAAPLPPNPILQLVFPKKNDGPKSKCTVHWIIKGNSAEYADYKNARLIEFQDMLCDRGVTGAKSLKYLVADLLQENGALNENKDGDKHGSHFCSIGIVMRNVCNYGYTTASFRAKFPAWNNYKTQLHWLADDIAWREKKFDGNIFRVVVYHNNQVAAKHNNDSCRYIGSGKNRRWSCYFWGEVSQHVPSLKSI